MKIIPKWLSAIVVKVTSSKLGKTQLEIVVGKRVSVDTKSAAIFVSPLYAHTDFYQSSLRDADRLVPVMRASHQRRVLLYRERGGYPPPLFFCFLSSQANTVFNVPVQ
jgi:hypothetical protein